MKDYKIKVKENVIIAESRKKMYLYHNEEYGKFVMIVEKEADNFEVIVFTTTQELYRSFINADMHCKYLLDLEAEGYKERI